MSSAIPIISETLNSASADPSGAQMRKVQIFKRSLNSSVDSGNMIKASVAVASTTRTNGSYPTDNNSSFVVNAQNTNANRITEVVRGNQLNKGQSGFNSLSSAFSQSLGNGKFATVPDADILIKSPISGQSAGNGIQTRYGIDSITAAKMSESSFAANSVTAVNVGTNQVSNTTVGLGQKLYVLLGSSKVSTGADDLDASKVSDRIRQVQDARNVSVFTSSDLNNLSSVVNFLLPGSVQNGGIAQALSQNIDLVLNTVNTNPNSNVSGLLTNLKTNLVSPIVAAVQAVVVTDAVNGVLPLSSQVALKTSVFNVYFGNKVFGNFSSTGPYETGYDTTSNVFYGSAPTFLLTNEALNNTGNIEKIYNFTYNAIVNGGGG